MVLHLFDLPREIRDLIYVQYLLVKGGYILDFHHNTLRGADNKPIDLALMLTCRRIASEMGGLALSSNTLNFSTVYSEEHRTIAGRFDLIMDRLYHLRGHKVSCIRPGILSIPDDIWEDIAKAHPRFAPYVEVCKSRDDGSIQWSDNVGPPGSCGDTPSVFREFIHSALQTILSHKDRLNPEELAMFEHPVQDGGNFRPETLIHLNPNPWTITSSQCVEGMLSSMDSDFSDDVNHMWNLKRPGYRTDHIKHRYSAAAVAIRFLESLSLYSRLSIRSVVLNEDRASVAFPECHGLGLIPYCQENTRLRIERRVSMWNTVFQTVPIAFFGISTTPLSNTCLKANTISYPVAVWILEALELEVAGMPPGCFTLTLDGDSACSEIFQTVVRRDAVWQKAIDICLQKFLPPLPWDVRRRDSRNITGLPDKIWQKDNRWYLFEAFPQAIEDILAGNSIVKCTFGLGDAWGETCDVERLVEANQDRTMQEWKEAWYVREKTTFEPDPPSPGWVQLLCDNSLEPGLPITAR